MIESISISGNPPKLCYPYFTDDLLIECDVFMSFCQSSLKLLCVVPSLAVCDAFFYDLACRNYLILH
jgi:hypothetical protein